MFVLFFFLFICYAKNNLGIILIHPWEMCGTLCANAAVEGIKRGLTNNFPLQRIKVLGVFYKELLEAFLPTISSNCQVN